MQLWSAITSFFWTATFAVGLYFLFGYVLPRVYSRDYDLRSVAQELNRARASAAEFARKLRTSDDELQSARSRVTKLSAEVAEKSSALAEAKSMFDEVQADVDRLRVRLAASEARQQELQEVAEKASVVRWELASRFGNNEEARSAALNDLRRPPQPFTVLTPSPVERTASDSVLQFQRPDLSVSDSEGSASASDDFPVPGVGSPGSIPRADEWLHASALPGRTTEVSSQLDTSSKVRTQRPTPRLYGQSSYPPASNDTGVRRRGGRRRGPIGRRPLNGGPQALRPGLPPRPWVGAQQSRSDGELSAQMETTTRTSAKAGATPELVELQRAPWTASPEASEARRGLAMDALVQEPGAPLGNRQN